MDSYLKMKFSPNTENEAIRVLQGLGAVNIEFSVTCDNLGNNTQIIKGIDKNGKTLAYFVIML